MIQILAMVHTSGHDYGWFLRIPRYSVHLLDTFSLQYCLYPLEKAHCRPRSYAKRAFPDANVPIGATRTCTPLPKREFRSHNKTPAHRTDTTRCRAMDAILCLGTVDIGISQWWKRLRVLWGDITQPTTQVCTKTPILLTFELMRSYWMTREYVKMNH